MQRLRAKAMGLRAGMPDLQLLIPNNGSHGLFIEMKTEKGKATKVQREFHKKLADHNYTIVICRGFEEGMSAIRKYLRS